MSETPIDGKCVCRFLHKAIQPLRDHAAKNEKTLNAQSDSAIAGELFAIQKSFAYKCSHQSFQKLDGVPLEKVFYEYGVDLVVSGHVHNYERMFDIAPNENKNLTMCGKTTRSTHNPPATTYIQTGAAGNIELLADSNKKTLNKSAYRSPTYGFSKMKIYNDTHLFWQQLRTDNRFPDNENGKVIDETWIVQVNFIILCAVVYGW